MANPVPPLIDTHAHLDDERFAGDLPEVLARARSVGVEQIVLVATSAASGLACQQLASQYPDVLFPTAGIHPNYAAQAAANDWDAVVALAESRRVVALGETGLDRHWNDTPFPMQEDYFERHLTLARRLSLPVIIHCREAEADVVRLLRADFERHGDVRGVMHSFVGSRTTAEDCLHMGLHLSFAGMLTYKNAADLRALVPDLPIERLLVETDSPYLSPVPFRGKRNEPAFVAHTAACLAQSLDVSVARISEQTTLNARKLFGLPG